MHTSRDQQKARPGNERPGGAQYRVVCKGASLIHPRIAPHAAPLCIRPAHYLSQLPYTKRVATVRLQLGLIPRRRTSG